MTEPIDQATKDLIEKEAKADAELNRGKAAMSFMKDRIEGYIAGATAQLKELASLREQLTNAQRQYQQKVDHRDEQLKQKEEVIRELIPIAEKQMDYEKDRKHIFLKGPWPYEQYKAIITKAKSLTK